MKLILYIFFFTFTLLNTSEATNYYFSTNSGDDTRSALEAQNALTPWKSIDKLNLNFSLLQPGDSVLFAKSEIFRGTITVTKSGTAGFPIVFSDYGLGDKPTITGMVTLTGWVAKGNGIWKSNCPTCKETVNILTINDKLQALGRYPNANAPNKGYLTFESHIGKTQITDLDLSSDTDWTGAETVIRSEHWLLDRSKIIQQSGKQFILLPGTTIEPKDNFGYFFQNHSTTLDLTGEWCYIPATKNIELFYGTDTPPESIEVSLLKNVVKISNLNNIVLENIFFKGANENILDIVNCKNITIKQCELLFSGVNAINGVSSKFLTIADNVISSSNNNAINFHYNCNSSIIKNNTIKNTGIFPGMGKSGGGSYSAIQIIGNNNVIESNYIDSVGYIPIRFYGDSTLIKQNVIKFFTLIKDDGGGIYTWTGSKNKSPKGSKIVQNIVLNGMGAFEGTTSKKGFSCGIYMDDNTANVEISNNSVVACSNSGIYLHNSNDIICHKNILYNNGNQLVITHQDTTCPGCQMHNNSVLNNIFFSKEPTQLVAKLSSFTNDIEHFGILDSNIYWRPLDHNYEIFVNNGATGRNTYFLQGWQNEFHQDINSRKGPFPIPYFTVDSITGANKYQNGTFKSGIQGVMCWSAAGVCDTSWDKTGKLDGGSLQVSSNYVEGIKNHSSIIIGIGAVDASKNYRLKFSLLGTKKFKTISVYLRQSKSPYNRLTPASYCLVDSSRNENEFLFTPSFSETNASIGIDFAEEDGTLWLDNIALVEANVTFTNPDEYIRFEYNATTSVKNILLTDTVYDVRNKSYIGNLSLQPFSSIILMKKPPVVVDSLMNKSGNGNIIHTYPNPVLDITNFVLPENKNCLMSYQIFDISGMLIMSGQITNNQIGTEFHLNTQALKNGIYLLNVNADQHTYRAKFIKTTETLLI